MFATQRSKQRSIIYEKVPIMHDNKHFEIFEVSQFVEIESFNLIFSRPIFLNRAFTFNIRQITKINIQFCTTFVRLSYDFLVYLGRNTVKRDRIIKKNRKIQFREILKFKTLNQKTSKMNAYQMNEDPASTESQLMICIPLKRNSYCNHPMKIITR